MKQGGLYGLINTHGKFVVKPQFEQAHYFQSNGFAAVQKNGSWGFIDRNGQLVISPQFDYTSGFTSNNLAQVSVDGKWGLIDTKGQFVIEPVYEKIIKLSDEFYKALRSNTWTVYYKSQKVFVSSQ